MTTRHSSSHRGSTSESGVLIEMYDSTGRALLLSDQIGRGGEGGVFVVEGEPNLVGKVYHRTPVPADTLEKLELMVSRRSKALEAISAWPQSLLYGGGRREPGGILIPRIHGARHLHELYGTSTRRRHFPEAKWHHLLLAARNVAAAFDTMHQAGIVVGDVNQGNLLVDETMCVRFIDCDSFQVCSENKIFHCPVGTPHFTPPELQSKKLRDERRTPNHDLFGMAALMFHLIFVGRHPFAGRFFGAGELPIEKAIAERRFTFSRDRKALQVEPPPASLLLEDIPPQLAGLFERAFRAADGESRPTAREWVSQFDALIKARRACSFDSAHVYYSQLTQCPWCRIEDEGGPAFFVLDGSASMVSAEQSERLDRKVRRVAPPTFASVAPSQLAIPKALAPKRKSTFVKASAPERALGLLALSWGLCLAAPVWPWLLAAGTAGAATAAAMLLMNKEARGRREKVDNFERSLAQAQRHLHKQVKNINAAHHKRQASFDKSVAELEAEREHYYKADNQLTDVLVLYRVSQKNRYLSSQLIQDNVRQIAGMTPSVASTLQSWGVENAADVESIKLIGVPNVGPNLQIELMEWRRRVEQQFVFKPEHGVSLERGGASDPNAAKRFKAVQAKRILMAARQLDSLAAVGREQVANEVRQFEMYAEPAREMARQLRDFQSNRRPWERSINRSRAWIAGAAGGAPLAGLVAYWLFG